MIENMFDSLDAGVVNRISERPELMSDAEFMKVAAQSNRRDDRTPVELPLPDQIVASLNLALLSEYLETEFYSTGLNTPGLIPDVYRTVYVRLLLNETAQREILLGVLGSRAIRKPRFDYTARGRVADVFSNFATFVGVGQAFEDAGVRAYKGQAPNVQSDDFVLTTALRFHSVEARHAAIQRRIRRLIGADTQKPWITLNNRGNLPALVQGVYDGEENLVQLGFNLTTLPRLTNGSPEAISEAFDEPLTAGQVLAIVRPFVRGGLNAQA